ncbi:YkuS family protein [Alicyclobacillus sp. SO9]|uniref:YkuS family protein n=1 Tax=Alicyclobacillus sp. SO9 TaxID=2665646 RepID=UPI0018E79E37|nr:YkuS family protein [Alicyclobacillus sp. SO9]QQE79927.1 YkuS family protein [Alicyclobacillus sp. SO9]
MKRVAVEQGLHPVKAYLEQKGCQVIDMATGSSNVGDAAAIVLTGGDENIMGMEDKLADVPVVTADGLSPEEVYQRIERFIH